MDTVTELLSKLASNGVKLSVEAGRLNCYAQKGALTGDLKAAIQEHKAELIALLGALVDGEQARTGADIPARPTVFPLSAGQKGLYILQKISPEMTAYNVPFCIRLTGKLDVRVLEEAWSRVLDQYPLLTARIEEREGTLNHVIDGRCRTAVERHTVPPADQQDVIAYVRKRARRLFDLDRGPLSRCELLEINDHEWLLLLMIHHVILDGISTVVLLRALIGNYQSLSEGKPVSSAPVGSGYHDFVAWEESMLASKEGRQHADYWQQRLSGGLPSLELFPDLARRASPSFEGASVIEVLPADLSRDIRAFARANAILPSVVFLSAYKLLLHRYTGLDDIIVGMPVIVRPQQRFMSEVGYFMNMVPLRTLVGGTLKLSELLSRVKSTMLEAINHSSYPFELMLDGLQSKPGAKNPVFQANFAFQNFVSDTSFASLSREGTLDLQFMPEIGPEGYSDLGMEIFEKEAVFSVYIKYNPDLYARPAIERFCRHFAVLLKSITEGGDRVLHEYSIMPEEEKRRLLVQFNDTDADYPKDKCIHDFFAEQVALAPGQTAAIFGDQALTYRELNQKTSSLALYLQSHGVKPDSVVGLCLERSLEMMIGIMGTVQAGGAYLPLDPDYPDDRLTYMLQDSNAAIVLTQEKFRERIGSLVTPGTMVVCLDSEWPKVSGHVAALEAQGVELRREVRSRNVCYVIYTSGSTGKPKGALVEHQALVNRLHWMQKRYQIGRRDVVLQKTPYSFDVSVWEFFWPMMTGATVVFAVPGGHKDVHYLESLIDQAKVTTLHFVPSMLRAYLDGANAARGSVRLIFASGEALDRQSVDRYRAKFPNAALHNLYGPTEAAIDVTSFDCSTLPYPFVPIGTPIDNIQLYILDPYNHPQPIGVAGELHIAGDGLARGYLNRPELTREKFVDNPFRPGARMYKTGDLACWLEDGNIQYLGRIDTQVKIRGFRVEIGEVEARLNEYPLIQDSAVIARGEGADKQLVAFYRATESADDQLVQLSNDELRTHLLRTLPDYMVPAAFVSVAAIPLSSNGKVDRRALSRMEVTLASAQEYVAPRNETEKRLVEIWAEVLNVGPEKIGVNDNFFELGGHSLRAAQLIAKVRGQFGVDIPLKAFFDNGNVAQMARFLGTAEKSDVPVITPADRSQFDRLPLSYAQERLWFINQLEPDSAGYNLPAAVTITGELEIDQLDEAFNRVIARHENLRTVFPSQDGRAHQRILDRLDFKLERIDLSHYADASARDGEARRLCRAEAARPFDLAAGPLIRGTVIRLAEHEHILMLNMHHIVGDGWSIGVLISDVRVILDAFRQGREPELAPLAIQYVDYSIWQRQWLEEGGVLAQQLAYWQQKLAGVPESLDLATDFPRPAVQSFAGATRAFALDAQLTGQLKRLAEQQGGTLYMVLLAAFNVLLHRYTGQSDICVGSPIANRQYGQTDGLIGMFVNTLALRSQIAGDETFQEFLDKVKTTCLEAYDHQDVPFEKLVDLVHVQRNMAISPLFQVMLVLQNVDMGTPDERIRRYPVDSGISKFDLTLEFTETAEGLAASIEYSTALFKPETIARMVEHFVGLCRAIGASPTAKIQDLEYLGEAERRRLIVDYNATEAEYPRDKCIHDFFAERVLLHGGRTAAVCGENALTYQELYERSRELALHLQWQGVGPDSIVGLCLERSLEMMVGIMGTVLAGGAYMPLDPDYPDERLEYMLQDSHAPVVLTQEKWAGRMEALVGREARVVALDSGWSEVVQSRNAELRRDVQPHNLCYVIYTSGSTGRPKGVLNEHGALVNRLNWMQKRYPLTEADVVLQKTPYSFDVSVWEFFWPMMTGASVVFAAPGGHKDVGYLEDLVNDAKVTTLHYVPSMLYTFLENAKSACGSVRQVFCSGEALDRKGVDGYKARFPNAALHNLYGPTEAAIDVTSFDCSTLTYPFVPIGKPIDNIQIYILDQHNHLQPVGMPGELHIAGAGLARGYLNRPELTRAKFVTNPFGPGTRMYKTGDLARWLDDGNIQYLGRIDTQVKIRGFRIELGEIEARLNQHPEIQDSVVVAQGQQADKHLVAFYRARATTAEEIVQLPAEELRAHLLQALPDYMVPQALISLAAIPLNSNGKVDRGLLTRMDVAMASGRAYVGPRNDTERQLADIWAGVLNRTAERIGIHDDFFELGGHSLLATQLLSRIRRELDVDLPLKALFERTTVAQFAELIAAAKKSEIPPIRPIDRTEFGRLPLSFAQERLWFINQLEPDSAGYNVPGAVTINGELDIRQLEEAFNLIIARHENLRTVFPSHEGQAHQQVLDRVDFRLQLVDLSHYETREARDEEARMLCQADAGRPFDLARGPLFRGMAIKLGEHEHILMLNMHHIISDGWSIGVLIRELDQILAAFRQGRRPDLPPLPIQYVDYSVWQRRWLEEGGALGQQLAYWQKKLAGVPESLDLATDYARPSVQSFAGAAQTFVLDAPLTARLKRVAEQQGGTLYMVLLAVLDVLLHRYTGQNDICVGSPIANRQYVETEGLIGMFVNLLALRNRVESSDTFAALLSQVRNTCLEAYEHQDAPFARVVDLLQPRRNLAISPIFQVLITLQNTESMMLGPAIQRYPLDSGISKYDLNFDFTETPEGLAGSIEYCSDLFKPRTVARMVEHFVALCQAITITPDALIRDLSYVGEAEKQQLLIGFNDTRADFPSDQCLHQLFAEQVARCPERTAVVSGIEHLTYQELYDRSRDLALYLQSEGVGPDSLVGLCMERSLDMVVSLLGILQAGGAYVPLDPDYPDDRLAHMLRDSRAAILLTQEKLQDKLASLVTADTRLVALDRRWAEIEARVAGLKRENVQLLQRVEPHHLAYVIYTSGSTGRPKGVMNEHRGVVNRLIWMQRAYELNAEDAVLQKTPFSFDVSVWEFFWPLLTGARLVMARPEGHKDPGYLAETIRRNRITTLHFVPPMLQVFLEHAEAGQCLSLTRAICSGEALPSMLARRFRERLPYARLYNLYGPTEAAVDVTAWTCPTGEIPTIIPIGRPIANTQMYILDGEGAPVPIGVVGELYIGGVQVARGYLNQPVLTAERFVPDPFAAERGTRMYKTGDLARWQDDGTIEFLGRNDFQVKIRGFRIELGEIEARLMEHEGVREAVVLAREEGPGEKRLVAYYTPSSSRAFPDAQHLRSDLRAFLGERLPEYMVPAAYVALDEMPLTPNGKLDRKALPAPEAGSVAVRAYEPPQGEVEIALARIWSDVLKVDRIGRNDSFFELGGHSLSAVQVMAKIHRRFEQLLPLAVMFNAPTIAALANLLSGKERPSFEIVVPIQTRGDGPPVFAVPGAGGNVLSMRPLSRTLGDGQPFYALQAVGLDGRTPPFGSVEQTAQANVVAMKSVQPAGPYCLIGHSYGGVVAYEMARILLEQGEEVSSLILLDSIAPPLMQENPAGDEAAELAEACMALARLQGANLEIDVDRIRRSSHEENVHYLVGLLNDHGQEIGSEQFAAFYDVYRANLLCYDTYIPATLPRRIDVSLYRATQGRMDGRNLPRDYGWEKLLQGPVCAFDVEADHFSILEKAPVREVVNGFNASLGIGADVPDVVRAT